MSLFSRISPALSKFCMFLQLRKIQISRVIFYVMFDKVGLLHVIMILQNNFTKMRHGSTEQTFRNMRLFWQKSDKWVLK